MQPSMIFIALAQVSCPSMVSAKLLTPVETETCNIGYTPNPPTNIVDFRGLDSSIILIQRDGILMSIGDFPESLSRAMLVGIM